MSADTENSEWDQSLNTRQEIVAHVLAAHGYENLSPKDLAYLVTGLGIAGKGKVKYNPAKEHNERRRLLEDIADRLGTYLEIDLRQPSQVHIKKAGDMPLKRLAEEVQTLLLVLRPWAGETMVIRTPEGREAYLPVVAEENFLPETGNTMEWKGLGVRRLGEHLEKMGVQERRRRARIIADLFLAAGIETRSRDAVIESTNQTLRNASL